MEIKLIGKYGAGKVALVDEMDEAIVLGHRWYVARTGYVCRSGGSKGGAIFLHREIMQPPKGLVVDHINDDPLDNRRSNLRIVTTQQNVGRSRRLNKHGYRGIRQDLGKSSRGSAHGAFVASISKTINGRVETFYLGHHPTPEEAARAYDAKAIELYGEFARLNFPQET